MYVLILSCNHQVIQNNKPAAFAAVRCPDCQQDRAVVSVQEYRRDVVYARSAAARDISSAGMSTDMPKGTPCST